MRLDEALRETGKAIRCHVRGAKELVVDRMFVTLIPTDFAIATDWEPYHDPPKEKRLRHGWFDYGGGNAIPVREVSPERDEIVRAAVAVVKAWRSVGPAAPRTWAGGDLWDAVEAWEKAGRPA